MFLLRKTADGPQGAKSDLVALLSSQDLALDLAREWVELGQDDGTATREETWIGENGRAIFRTYRRTRFGQRRATVQPLALDDTDKGLA